MITIVCVQVEKTRHVILLREKLAEQNKSMELSKLDKEIVNRQAKVGYLCCWSVLTHHIDCVLIASVV